MTSQAMILSGQLADWSLRDLLQILQITQKTAQLEVEAADQSGTLYFRDGELIDAELGDGPSTGSTRDRIVEAVYSLGLAEDGKFVVGSHERDSEVSMDMASVLSLAEQLAADVRELQDSGALDAPGLALGRSGEAVTLAAEDWETLSEVVGSFSFEELRHRLGRIRAMSFVNALQRLGALERTDGTDSTFSRPQQPAEVAPEVPVDTPELAGDPAEELVDEEDSAVSEEFAEVVLADDDSEIADETVFFTATATTETAELPAAPAHLTVVELDSLADESPIPTDLSETARRQMKSVISPADTTLVPGVLGDLRQRFRHTEDRRF